MVMVTILHSIKYTFGWVVDCAQWIEHLKWPHSDISIDFWCFITVVDVIWILVVDMLIFYPANTVKHKSTSVKVKVFFCQKCQKYPLSPMRCICSAQHKAETFHPRYRMEVKVNNNITVFICMSEYSNTQLQSMFNGPR